MPDLAIQGLLPPSSYPVSDPSTQTPVTDSHFHKHVLSPGTAKGSWDRGEGIFVPTPRSLTGQGKCGQDKEYT